MRARTALLALLVCASAGALAGDVQAPGRPGIASAHPLATQAGYEAIEKGGNAFDAAVAVSAALGVVEPYASGFGGGAFFLLHIAESGTTVFVDAREVAPAAANADMYLDSDGEPVRGASLNGPLAAGIPGHPAGLVHLANKYGRLSLADSLAPAIRYANDGFPVHRRISLGLRFRRQTADQWKAFGEVFYPGGVNLADGDPVLQPDLAKTLQRLASAGADGFYRGETARLLVDGVRAAGGIWSLEDLAGYRVAEREPIYAEFRGARVVSAPPPSSGGIAIANMLNILDGFDIDGADEATRKHLLIEAMRRAYRDRAQYLGDPDFVAIPVEKLVHPYYAAGQRVSMRLDRATPSETLPGIWPEGAKAVDTSHFSIIDADGNRVAGTQSINAWFGSGFMAPRTGVILNNEMDDFVVKAGVPNGFELVGAEANAIAPGKRMLSSMSPTFVESDRGVAILGTPGGSRIITMVMLATLAWIDGANAADMVSLKRFHHQYYPDVVSYEPGAFTEEELVQLEAMGHRMRETRRAFGNMNVVTWDYASGQVDAASDPRGGGEGRLY
jgi:gamma-glutamyltranspeptidase/glutathione hydrolase